MSALSLQQRLLLVKYLTERLAVVRKDDLLPQAAAEMPSGSRIPVMFAGQHAGWASMPQPTRKSAFVADGKALLAWAEKHHPGKVAGTETAIVTDEVLAVLREHLPGAIVRKRQVDPQWVADILAALKGGGYYVTADGEKLTEVPGVTVPESDPPSPRVELADGAGPVIGAAWQAGDIPVAELLALPVGEAAQ